MPSSEEHIELGIVYSITDSILQNIKPEDNSVDWRMVIADILIKVPLGAFVSILPDLIEPAKNPNHRSIFHSFAFAGLLIWLYFYLDNYEMDVKVKDILKFSIKQYIGHLGLDLTTPKGLPIIN